MMQRLRDAWQVLRGYAAAQDSRASAWAPSGGSATAEVGMAAPTVARRARDAVRNDPYPRVRPAGPPQRGNSSATSSRLIAAR